MNTRIKLNKFYRLKTNEQEVWKIQDINNNQITLVNKKVQNK